MKHLKIAAALTASTAALAAGTVQAAVVTRSYVTTATFLNAPVAAVTLTYRLTFDPQSGNPTGTVSNYTSSSDLAAFAAPVGALFYASGNALVGKSPSGIDGVTAGTNDFVASFAYDANGDPTLGSTTVYFTISNSNNTYFASTAETVNALVAGVPEPATWGLMLAGFGIVGAGLRVRRRSVNVATD